MIHVRLAIIIARSEIRDVELVAGIDEIGVGTLGPKSGIVRVVVNGMPIPKTEVVGNAREALALDNNVCRGHAQIALRGVSNP